MNSPKVRSVRALLDTLGLPAAVSLGLHLSIFLWAVHIVPAGGEPRQAQAAPIMWAQLVAAPAPAAPATSAAPQMLAEAQKPEKKQPPIQTPKKPPEKRTEVAQKKPEPAKPQLLARQTRTDKATQQAAQPANTAQAEQASTAAENQAQPITASKQEGKSGNQLGHGSGSQIGSAPAAQTATAPLRKARPNYAHSPPPDYPSLLQDEGIGGVVWIKVWVEVDGKPSQITLLRGSGYRMLDDSALRAVQTWRFHPAKQGEQALASWVEFPVRFNAPREG